MIRLHLTLLGGFHARAGRSWPAISLGRNKAKALLAHLAVAPGRLHLRDAIAWLLDADGSSVDVSRFTRLAATGAPRDLAGAVAQYGGLDAFAAPAADARDILLVTTRMRFAF